MPTDAERNKRFRAERRRADRVRTRIQRDTFAEIQRLLKEADERLRVILAGAPSEFQSFLLPQLQQSIRQAMQDIGERASQEVSGRAGEAWQAGIELVDAPLDAGGIRISGVVPTVDTRQLVAMRSFMTDRIRDVTLQVANRINSDLGLVAIGAQTPSEAIGNIARYLGAARGRAVTIVRTELGRAYATATQERLMQASTRLPGMKKQWGSSGRRENRPLHQAIIGQVVEVDEPFILPNGVKLMYPRDPKAPASETINCGHALLPFMDHWETTGLQIAA